MNATTSTIDRPQSISQSVVDVTVSQAVKGQTLQQEDGADAEPALQQTLRCVSVVEEGSQIAFACYDEDINTIIIEQSYARESDTCQVIEQFYAATRPTMILLSNKIAMNTVLLETLTKPYQYQDESNAPTTIPYRQIKSSAYNLKKAQALVLQNLRVLELIKQHEKPANFGPDRSSVGNQLLHEPSPYHWIASVVNFDSCVQIRALGALVSFLQSTIFRLEDGGTVTVAAIKQAHSSMYMRIPANTLQALHIFSVEHHPLMAKGQYHSKEGFSLYSLLGDRTKSPMGKRCMRDWMLKPLIDGDAIGLRQDAIELLLRREFDMAVGSLFAALENIGDVDLMIQRMMKYHTAPVDFVTFCRSLSATIEVCRVLQVDFVGALRHKIASSKNEGAMESDDARDLGKLNRYLAFVERILHGCSVPVIGQLQERVSSAIDIELTIEERDTVIKTGYHEELDNTKELYDNLQVHISQLGSQLLQKHPNLDDVKVTFMTQIGFLVELPRRPHFIEQTSYSDLPPDFSLVFNEKDSSYFKNDETTMLDQEYGDPISFISDTEQMIIREIEDDILDCESELRTTFGTLAELDCLLALAECASDLDFTRPQIRDAKEKRIDIVNGRHPLQELVTEGEFVPNSSSVDSRNRLNIITGPNFSGKSCYVRQVGLLVYMAHIGSFLPCDSAKISITDQILTRISVADSCIVPQSSFQIDMTQMGTILRRSTNESLVLIDEFGKGTSPSSGIAVLAAALRALSMRKAKVVCATHFLEIFSLGLVHDGVEGIKAMRMAVQLPSNDHQQAIPLFKLENGVADCSAGLSCAEIAGVSRKVISRAGDIILALKNGGKIEAAVDVIMRSTTLPDDAKEAMTLFIRKENWGNATESEIRRLMHHVNRMTSH